MQMLRLATRSGHRLCNKNACVSRAFLHSEHLVANRLIGRYSRPLLQRDLGEIHWHVQGDVDVVGKQVQRNVSQDFHCLLIVKTS